MSVLESVVREEMKRSLEKIEILNKQILELPKGRIREKRKKKSLKVYYYLRYSENGKIIDEYIKAELYLEIKKKIDRKKRLKSVLKKTLENVKFSRKVFHIKDQFEQERKAITILYGERKRKNV